MKKVLFILTVTILTFCSCSKDNKDEGDGGGGGSGTPGEGYFSSSETGDQSGETTCSSEDFGEQANITNSEWTLVASFIDNSGSVSFTTDFYTSEGECIPNCDPAIQLFSSDYQILYIATSGTGSWSGNTFTFDVNMKLSDDFDNEEGSSFNLTGKLTCE